MFYGVLLAVANANLIFTIFLCFFTVYAYISMRGNCVDLRDIVLVQQGELPENVNLRCGESLETSDDEGDNQEVEREQVQRVPPPRGDLYLVESACGICESRVVLVCRASNPGIRNLQLALVDGDLEFTCQDCSYGIQGAQGE